jgi:hypothetical protein
VHETQDSSAYDTKDCADRAVRRSIALEDTWTKELQGDVKRKCEEHMNWRINLMKLDLNAYDECKGMNMNQMYSDVRDLNLTHPSWNVDWRLNRALDPNDAMTLSDEHRTEICLTFHSLKIHTYRYIKHSDGNATNLYMMNDYCLSLQCNEITWQNPPQKMQNCAFSTPHTPWAGQPLQICMQDTTTGVRHRDVVEGNKTEQSRHISPPPFPLDFCSPLEFHTNKITGEFMAFFFQPSLLLVPLDFCCPVEFHTNKITGESMAFFFQPSLLLVPLDFCCPVEFHTNKITGEFMAFFFQPSLLPAQMWFVHVGAGLKYAVDL